MDSSLEHRTRVVRPARRSDPPAARRAEVSSPAGREAAGSALLNESAEKVTAVLSDMGGMILRSRAHYDDLLLLQAYFGDFHTDLVGSFVGISVVCSGISKRIGLLKVLLQKNHKQAAEKHIQRLNDDVSRGSTESSALIERFVPIIRNIEHF